MTEIKTMKQIAAVQRRAEALVEAVQDLTTSTVEAHIEGLNASDTAKVYRDLKLAYETAEEAKKHMGKVYDFMRMNLMPNKMDDEGIESFKVPGVGRVYLTDDLNASIVDKKAGYDWLEEHGHGDLITETVNGSSLKALLRRLIADGKEVPEDIFKITPITRAVISPK